MNKEKEKELSEWVVARYAELHLSPNLWPFVAMDGDGEVTAHVEEPVLRGRVWNSAGGGEYEYVGYLPEDLRIYPFGEFLLKWCAGESVKEWAARVLGNGSGHGGETPPPLERVVWVAEVMGEAFRVSVEVVCEPLPAPMEVAGRRRPTDEELSRLLPGGWCERCPIEV